MSFDILIPARTDSTRMHRKLYAVLDEKSVLQHTWERARQSNAERVAVVCKDEEMAQFANSFGAVTILTDGKERNGTEACAQAIHWVGLHDNIVIVQGDECRINPATINTCAELLEERDIVVTLCCPMLTEDTGSVSVVTDINKRLLYCSRAPLPAGKKTDHRRINRLRHIGIYGYKKQQLTEYKKLYASLMETIEGLEQLRLLYHGIPVLCESVFFSEKGLDTPEDWERIHARL